MSEVLQDGTTILDTPQDIAFFQLLSLRGACKLEMVGLNRRGRSALAIARERYGMPKRTPAAAVVDALNAEVAQRRAERKPQ